MGHRCLIINDYFLLFADFSAKNKNRATTVMTTELRRFADSDRWGYLLLYDACQMS